MIWSSSTLTTKLTVSAIEGTLTVKVPPLTAGVVVASEPYTNPVPGVTLRVTLPAVIRWGCTLILMVWLTLPSSTVAEPPTKRTVGLVATTGMMSLVSRGKSW